MDRIQGLDQLKKQNMFWVPDVSLPVFPIFQRRPATLQLTELQPYSYRHMRFPPSSLLPLKI